MLTPDDFLHRLAFSVLARDERLKREPVSDAGLMNQREQEREAVAAALWDRLRELHARCGYPSADGPAGWLTEGVRRAEATAEAAWINARHEGTEDAHRRSLESLETWARLARCFIAAADENRGAVAAQDGRGAPGAMPATSGGAVCRAPQALRTGRETS